MIRRCVMRKPSLSLAAAAALALAMMSPAVWACGVSTNIHTVAPLQSSLNVAPINTISDINVNPGVMLTAQQNLVPMNTTAVIPGTRIVQSAVVSPIVQTEAWQGPIISPAFPVAQPVVIPGSCGGCGF